MPPAGKTVSTAAANHMAFAADDLAGMKVHDVGTNFHDLAHKLVPDDHRNGNRLPRPIVPLVNMDVCAADSRAVDLDQNVVDSNGRFRHVFEP